MTPQHVWVQDLAYVLATSYVATSILLSGFYIRIRDMRVSVMRGLAYLSYTKYAMQGVSRLELLGRTFDDSSCPTNGMPPTMPRQCIDSHGKHQARG